MHTGAAFANDYTEGFASFLNFLYVLLAFSVVVSLFGMVNTLVLSVFERTRELGMLRTIGMTRRQARRMIRHESVITALIGAALGLPLGIFLALLVTQALSQYDIAIVDPDPGARGLHGGRHPRRTRGGDHAGPPRVAAERARRAALRVSDARLEPDGVCPCARAVLGGHGEAPVRRSERREIQYGLGHNRVTLRDSRAPAVDSGERDSPRRTAANVHVAAVDVHVLDPRALRGVVGAGPQGVQERVRLQALGANLDPRPEAIPVMVPVRIVADGDVQPVAAREQMHRPRSVLRPDRATCGRR